MGANAEKKRGRQIRNTADEGPRLIYITESMRSGVRSENARAIE
jgi:hypothetical protein